MFHFRSWLKLMSHRREASRRARASSRKRKPRLSGIFRPFLERLESWILPSNVTWFGGTGDWSTAADWMVQGGGNRVPTIGDDVFINAGSVTHSGGTDEVHTISLASGATLAITGGSLTIDAASTFNGAFEMNNGTFTQSGLTLSSTSSTTWSGGTISGSAALTNAGNLSITGTVTLSNETLVNQATVSQGNVTVYLDNGTLSNQAGALWDMQSGGGSYLALTGGGSGAFNNSGTLRHSDSGNINTGNVAFNNAANGIVDVTAGMLSLTGGGTDQGGTFTVASGTTLELAGGSSPTLTGTYTGSGGGTVQFSSGTLNIGAANATFNFPSGLFQWTGGTITGATLTNTNNVSIAGTVTVFGNSLVNQGTVSQGNVTVLLDNGTLSNQAGALWDMQNGGGSYLALTGGGGQFNNSGTLQHSGGGGINLGNVAFNNAANGTVNVTAGTLSLSGGGTDQGGTFTVSSGATLELAGGSSPTLTGTYTGSGGGTVQFSSGTLNMGGAGATFNFPSGLFQWTGGTITGATLTNTNSVSIAGTVTVFGNSLVNQGTVSQGNVTVYLDNGTLSNQAGAVWDMGSGGGTYLSLTGGGSGQFNNSGTLRHSGGGGINTGNVNLDNPGTIEVRAGSFSVTGGLNQVSGNTLTAGSYHVFGSATLDVSASITTNNAFITLDGAGATFNSIQNLATNGGSFTVTNGATFTTAGAFTNNAALTVGLASTINISGAVTEGSSAGLTIQIGGPSSGTQFGKLAATGTVNLAGTFTASTLNSYIPTSDDRYTVMTFGSKSADFGLYNLPFLDGSQLLSQAFAPPVNPTSLVLSGTFETHLVTNTNDTGAGSLRQAMLDTNTYAAGKNLYIANAGTNTLIKVDPLGNQSTFANSGGGNPEGVAVDSAGNIYVANVFGSNIEKFSQYGQDLGAFATTGVNDPGGMKFDSQGNLYLANVNTRNVEKYSPTGQDLGSFVTVPSAATDVAFDSQGNLYVANGNIVSEFSSTGTSLGTFISSGLAGADGLTFDSQGNLYVSNYPGNYVEKYSPTGVDLGQFAAGSEGLAFDGQGNLYAVNYQTQKVEKYSPTGVDLGAYASGLSSPTFLAFGPQNSGPQITAFNIPGNGPFTIQPNSVLPSVTSPIILDATTQPGYVNQPLIVLDGTIAGSGAVPGLTIQGGSSYVRGFAIDNFSGDGIDLQNGTNSHIAANYVGVNATGLTVAGNHRYGVYLLNTTNDTIGGANSADRNVISGNSFHGVFVDATSSEITIQGNYIGIAASGNALAGGGNGFHGILAQGSSNIILGNVIGGNGSDGVQLDSSSDNQVNGNYIGTDASGLLGIGNGTGILMFNAQFNTIGGAGSSNRNVIASSSGDGIGVWNSSNNLIGGNYIGIAADGLTGLGNQGDGVDIFGTSTGNNIDASGLVAINIISGNAGAGVHLSGSGVTGNWVHGNYISTDASGTIAKPNAVGVLIDQGSNGNTIGGLTTPDLNVISGNNTDGIRITDAGTTGNLVEGNYIGSDKSGSTSVSNSNDGVLITSGATGNTVGGDANAGAANVISGNLNNGVEMDGSTTTGNVVQGNKIGTDVGGSFALTTSSILGSQSAGVVLLGASGNTIGGDTALGAFGNLLSGNANYGVLLSGSGTSNNLIEGNNIGTNAALTADIANNIGVNIINLATNNTVGGGTGPTANVVSGNNTGVIISDSGTTGNVVQGNFVGTDRNGTATLGNALAGIKVENQASGNTIGGSAAGPATSSPPAAYLRAS